MIGVSLFLVFLVLMVAGVPIGVSMGLSAAVAIALANLDTQWFGLLAVPQNFYAGLGKYPLLAIPMFVLVGIIFNRSGVALRLVRFAVSIFGQGPGMLPLVAIAVAMLLGGISGSGPATAAAVGSVMIAAMTRAGYPPAFSASVIGAAAAIDIIIPPSVALIIYSVLVPGASVPAMFAAGMIPGIMVGLAMMIPSVWLAKKHQMGLQEDSMSRPPFWESLREASWGLAAPVLILGGMRLGWFTPTEAAVVAVFYGLFVGMVIHRSITVRDLFGILRDAGELSAVILLVVALAGIFAYSLSTLGIIDPITEGIVRSGLGEYGVLILLVFLLIFVGMFLDGISIFLILVPILLPIAAFYQWDLVWFGILLTLMVAIGQFTPPLAVNLMVSCRIAQVSMERTVRWVCWLLLSVFCVLLLVIVFPPLALWLPRTLGY
ncbi:TRAP transporter large permease [Desulfofustis limnaeus]|uniref:C4-dicarboxylate ABC transporter n=1 Tax=Desulfofustis limnaeus TaxID=2740163 RepID=A0ABM7W569_9BACT|nr:TRAP transporter large permease [Desulfofustis limnaeus]BDD86010.1 C4-dicarboxylate ABC transporter [Desulfofustis limnaeus]